MISAEIGMEHRRAKQVPRRAVYTLDLASETREGWSMKMLFCAVAIVGLLGPSAGAQQTVAGDWMLTAHEQFGPNIIRLSLAIAGETLTGTAGGRKIEGTVRGAAIEFKMDNATARGSLTGAELSGETIFPDRTVKWTAVRIGPRPPSPKTHEFEPSSFHL